MLEGMREEWEDLGTGGRSSARWGLVRHDWRDCLRVWNISLLTDKQNPLSVTLLPAMKIGSMVLDVGIYTRLSGVELVLST